MNISSTITDRERIQRAYGLLKGAAEAPGYIINKNQIPLYIKTIEDILHLLNDDNYDLASTTEVDTP